MSRGFCSTAWSTFFYYICFKILEEISQEELNAVYKIEDKTFIAETYWEYELLKGITSKSFHKKIKLNNVMNF